MGNEPMRETDIAYIDKLLSDVKDRAQDIYNKAYELNNRTTHPTDPEEEKPTGDVGTEIKGKLIRINTILVEAITSLEAFV